MKIRLRASLMLAACFATYPLASQSAADIPLEVGKNTSAALVAEKPLRWVPGQIIVKYKPGRRTSAEGRLRNLGIASGSAMRETSGGEYVYTLPEPAMSAMSTAEARTHVNSVVARMAADDAVEYAQPNYLAHIVRVPDDPGYPLQWHYFNNGSGGSPGGINLPDAWDRTTGSPSVVLAVIDTGILPNHPDISASANLLAGFDMITDTFTANDGDGRDTDPTDPGDAVAAGECDADSSPQDDSWHGTHVAGTIGVGNSDNAAGVAGINWHSRVLPVRALGRCGGSIADINDAIRWAAGLPVPGAPSNPNPAKVINMSLGAAAPCSASPATQSAIDDVVAAGVTVVVAAGNEARDAANAFPASCNSVITVAASDFNGELVTRYSNYGAVVDIMAPGGDLRADRDNDGNPDGVLSMVQGGYAFFNGTSMSAPHVTGVAGLLLAQDGKLGPQQIEQLLKANALPRTGSQQCSRACGAGLLNANIDVNAPVPRRLTLNVAPSELELDEGEVGALTATVANNGSPLSGEQVNFLSSDISEATVAPPTATTDAAGIAIAQVTGVDRGDTEIVISIQGQSQVAPVSVDVRVVPALGLILLTLLLITLFAYAYRRGAWSRARR